MKLVYALPEKTRYEMTEKVKENEVLDYSNHGDKNCILRKLKKTKDLSSLVESLKSETHKGVSSWSNFSERPTLEELETDKPVLLEIEHLRGKVTVEQLEVNEDVLYLNQDVFSKDMHALGAVILFTNGASGVGCITKGGGEAYDP